GGARPGGARGARSTGRVVRARAIFDAPAGGRAGGGARGAEGRGPPRRGRRHYDVPADHFTRYDLALMREQASRSLELEIVHGISLGWGVPLWARAVERLPSRLARGALQPLDAGAPGPPAWADVVVLAGRPRRSRSSR